MRLNLRDRLAAVERLRERRRLYASEEQHLGEVLAEAAAAVPVVPQQRTAAPSQQNAP